MGVCASKADLISAEVRDYKPQGVKYNGINGSPLSNGVDGVENSDNTQQTTLHAVIPPPDTIITNACYEYTESMLPMKSTGARNGTYYTLL